MGTIHLNAQVPAITGFNPATACAGQTVTVTLTGTAFTDASAVSFNGVNALPFNVVSDTQIDVALPAAASTGKISVTTPGGTGLSTLEFQVNPILPVSVSITASSTAICEGTSVTFTASPINGGTSPAYQWFKNGSPLSGETNATYTSNILSNGDLIKVTLTSSEPCTSGNPATSNAITMTVNPNLPASISILASATTVCAGTAVTYSATAVNGGTTPSFQWLVNGNPAGSNSATFVYTPSNNDVITCILTSNALCVTGSPATSNAVTMTVNPLLPVSITIAESSNSVCPGTAVTYTASGVNGGSNPVYQWKVNNVNVGVNLNTYSHTPLNGDVITCVFSSNATCTSGNPATSNAVTMVVNPNLPVSVAIVSSDADNSICQGTSVTFNASPVNGGPSPAYQWKLNGANVGNNQDSYTTTSLGSGNIVTVVLTSDITPCATGNPATSNAIATTVLALQPVSVSIGSNDADNSICPGTSVTFTATPVNGGPNPIYQWKLNGGNVGANQNTYTTSSLANGDKVTVVLTSDLTPCATGNPATSNEITTFLLAVQPVSVSLVSNDADNTICQGTPVAFTALPVNGGPNPSYQWKVNGGNVGANQNTFVTSALVNGDKVTVVLTSDITPCATNNPATSNEITSSVLALQPVSVTIVSSDADNSICVGTGVTFTATPVNGGLNPTYQWKLNGSNVGSNQNTYTTSTLASGDKVTVVMTSNITPCPSGNPAVSNEITTTVNAYLPVGVSITSNDADNAVCSGTSVTFTATPTNGGTTPTYQWKRNGSNVGTNSPAYTYSPANGDIITCVMTSNAACPSLNPATSNPVSLTVYSDKPDNIVNKSITGPNSICPPVSGQIYSVVPVARAQSYVWTLPTGFTITAGGGTATITVSVSIGANIGTSPISVYATNSCGSGNDKSTDVNVNTFAGVSAGPDKGVCVGGSVALEGLWDGATTSSTWSAPSGTFSNISITNPTYTPSISSGSVVLTITSNDPAGTCPATSDQMIVTVNPLPTAGISGSTTVCRNAASPLVTFTGSSGTAPFTFTYTINGGASQTITTTAGNSVTLSAPTNTAGTYTYNLVSVQDANSCSQAQTGSATILVNPSPTASISGTAAVCLNAASPLLTFTGNSGTEPYTFSYNINGGPALSITTTTGNTVTLSAPTGVAGTFVYNLVSVQDANSCSQLQTGSATVTIHALPTAGISGATTVCLNAASPLLTLTGSSGTAPYTFTYNKDGGPVQSITTTAGNSVTFSAPTAVAGSFTYNLASIQDANSCAQAQTGSATITVNTLPTAVISGTTSVCRNAASPSLTFTGNSGTAPYTFTYNIDGGPVQSITTTTGNSVTLSAPTSVAGIYTYNLVGVQDASNCSQSQSGSAIITVNSPPTATISGTASVCQNTASPLITLTGSTGTEPYTFTYNINGGPVQSISTIAGNSVTLGAPTGTAGTFTYNLLSVQDAANCSQAQTGSATITVIPPSTAPSSLSVSPAVICSGSSISLTQSGGSLGNGAIWRWYSDNTYTNPVGTSTAADASLTITPASTTTYYLRAEGTLPPCADIVNGPVSGVSVTVNQAPSIITQPAPAQTVCSGSTVSFSVTASGTGLTYQWRKGNTNLIDGGSVSGATTTTLTLANVQWTDAASDYNVVITGSSPCGLIYSANAALTVYRQVSIGSEPVNTGACGGWSNAGLSVTASGDITGYQWYKGSYPGGVAMSDGGNISGTSTSSLNFQPAQIGDDGYYYVEISGQAPCTVIRSVNVRLNVDEAITITDQPDNTTLCEGSSLTLSVTADGNGDPLSYQWRRSGVPVGTNSSSLTINPVTPGDEGSYDVVISKPSGYCSQITSQAAQVTVQLNSTLTLTSAPATSSQTICINTALTDITYAIGGGGNGASITAGSLPSGLTGSFNAGVFTISGTATTAGTFSYTVTTSGPCTNVSLSGTITVNPDATITLTSGIGTDAQTVCEGNAIAPITYAIGGSGTGASITAGALPTGVTGNFAGGIYTLAGTPAVPGVYSFTVTTTGLCLNGSLSGTITVNASSTIILSSGSANQLVCRNEAMTPIIYTLGGTATGALVSGNLPPGVSSNYSAGLFSISGIPGTEGTYSYTVTTTGPCSNVSLSGTITVSPPSVAGTITPELTESCAGYAPAATLTLSGSTGSTITWQSSTNGGLSWSNIPGASGAVYSYPDLHTPTLFRVEVTSGSCDPVYSDFAAVTMIPELTPVINSGAIEVDMCVGGSVTLTVNAGFGGGTIIPGPFTGGSFNDANPAGWCRDNLCTGSFLPAQRDNEVDGPWGETNGPKLFSGVTYDTNDNTKFAIANGNLTSKLTSPAFSLLGANSAAVDWRQSFKLESGASAIVQISLDGGSSWSTLESWAGPATFGNPIGLTPAGIDLSGFIGQSNIKLQWTFSGTTGSSWAIDQISLPPPPGGFETVTYEWTPDATLAPTDGQTVIATPGTTTTYYVTTHLSGCEIGTSTPIIVNVVPLPSTADAGPDLNLCVPSGPASTTISGNVPVNGNGTWSIISGTATITNPNSPTTTVTGMSAPSYVYLRYTISNAPCNISVDEMVITVDQAPDVAVAGPDLTGPETCDLTTVSLNASQPVVGTGSWTGGCGGTFGSLFDPKTTFTGTAGSTYTLTWNVTSVYGICATSTDEVIVTFNQNPTTASASDSWICMNDHQTLTGNVPVIGAGNWSIVSGPDTSIGQVASPTQANAIFTPTVAGDYTLRWTISNPPCDPSTADMKVTVYPDNAWHGGFGSPDYFLMHDWHTPGNWCGGVPDATKDAIIPPTPWNPIISSALPADCKDLNIYTGARLFINSDAASSGSLIVHGSQTGSGTVTYNRYTDASRYYLISSPVSGADISPLMATSNGFAPYNEPSNSWGGYLTSGTLSNGVGYAMYRTSNSSDLPFTGSISGDVTVPVSSSYSRYGWNSLGNPYTSAINAKDSYGFIARNYAVFHPGYAAVYIWNAVANTYWVITQTGYYYENLWHDYYQFGMYTGVGHIQAGQGFLINVVWPATNPTIVFEKAM